MSQATLHQQRMCIACRKRADQDQLLRIVFMANVLRLDAPKRMQTRGAYLHRECIGKKQAFEVRRWVQALRVPGESVGGVVKVLPDLIEQLTISQST